MQVGGWGWLYLRDMGKGEGQSAEEKVLSKAPASWFWEETLSFRGQGQGQRGMAHSSDGQPGP